MECEPSDGTAASASGRETQLVARAWVSGREGIAAQNTPGDPSSWRDLVERALVRATLAGPGSPPRGGGGPRNAPTAQPAPPPSEHSAKASATRLVDALASTRPLYQALLIRQWAGYRAIASTFGSPSAEPFCGETGFVRLETALGPLVDGWSRTALGGEPELEKLVERLRRAQAVSVMAKDNAPLPDGLPVALTPLVAAPLVLALSSMLRGDAAAAQPALARSLGKKLFPAALTVVDDPRAPEGFVRRTHDDESVGCDPLVLVREGRLEAFCHSSHSAALLKTVSNGRGHRQPDGSVSPAPFQLEVKPSDGAPPGDRIELCARYEPFTTGSRKGSLCLFVSGELIRGGAAAGPTGLLELRLPVLKTWQSLMSVGVDREFLPTVEGVGTPTLVFAGLMKSDVRRG